MGRDTQNGSSLESSVDHWRVPEEFFQDIFSLVRNFGYEINEKHSRPAEVTCKYDVDGHHNLEYYLGTFMGDPNQGYLYTMDLDRNKVNIDLALPKALKLASLLHANGVGILASDAFKSYVEDREKMYEGFREKIDDLSDVFIHR